MLVNLVGEDELVQRGALIGSFDYTISVMCYSTKAW
jgi:hypothetical protein